MNYSSKFTNLTHKGSKRNEITRFPITRLHLSQIADVEHVTLTE